MLPNSELLVTPAHGLTHNYVILGAVGLHSHVNYKTQLYMLSFRNMSCKYLFTHILKFLNSILKFILKFIYKKPHKIYQR